MGSQIDRRCRSRKLAPSSTHAPPALSVALHNVLGPATDDRPRSPLPSDSRPIEEDELASVSGQTTPLPRPASAIADQRACILPVFPLPVSERSALSGRGSVPVSRDPSVDSAEVEKEKSRWVYSDSADPGSIQQACGACATPTLCTPPLVLPSCRARQFPWPSNISGPLTSTRRSEL